MELEHTEETSNGDRRRLLFLAESIAMRAPARVLDFGCGTGLITRRLAKCCPSVQFVGYDPDSATIVKATHDNRQSNVSFQQSLRDVRNSKFDAVIASEVLEHVDAPEEMLGIIRELLEAGGFLYVTTPNGFGAFEAANVLEASLALSGVDAVFNGFRHQHSEDEEETLANSPHVSFFAHGKLHRLFAACGFECLRERNRTLVCGFGFHRLLCTRRLRELNVGVADRVWPVLASGWMFELRKAASPATAVKYERAMHERWRRAILQRRSCIRNGHERHSV
jgi:2-polyprenyl-3-methyl-5-hydroxy-6-metoxy-1,4-benzoquinol methylase